LQFADDILLLVKSESRTGPESLMQTALNRLQSLRNNRLRSWADGLKLTINALKTQCIAFTLGNAKFLPKLSLYGQQLKCKPTLRYLGIILDSGLSCRANVYAPVGNLKA
ncbi:hypothetical protein Pmar_PMAR021976, partial [Perkinsus marinus ATCC 50983]